MEYEMNTNLDIANNNSQIIDDIHNLLYITTFIFTFFSIIEYNIVYQRLLLNFFAFLYDKLKTTKELIMFIFDESFLFEEGVEFEELKKKEKNEKEENEEKKEIKYEDKYKDKYLLLKNNPLSKDKIDALKNTILLENTPLGNIIMFYDNNKESFTYYSDNTIPYRFLETVARKYVILYNCKSIFIDMEEELNSYKIKLEEKKRKKSEEEEQKKIQKELNNFAPLKRDVFAKLKSYNKDSGLKVAGISGESKYSSNKKTTNENEDNMILKEKSNKYSCEGKIMNFTFLKKVERKLIDKKYSMTFSEFKKIHLNN